MSNIFLQIPLIPPTLSFKLKTSAMEILSDLSEGSNIVLTDPKDRIMRVFVMRNSDKIPMIAATINMPPTEPAY